MIELWQLFIQGELILGYDVVLDSGLGGFGSELNLLSEASHLSAQRPEVLCRQPVCLQVFDVLAKFVILRIVDELPRQLLEHTRLVRTYVLLWNVGVVKSHLRACTHYLLRSLC